eukprot:g29138.t1
MHHSVLALDDVIFSVGSVASSSYYVAEGGCSYESPEVGSLKLCESWVAEVCLWTPWVHMGYLASKDISRLISLEVTSFCECIGHDRHVWQMASEYAREFLETLNEKSHWSDLHPDRMDHVLQSDLAKAELVEKSSEASAGHGVPTPGSPGIQRGLFSAFKKVVPG